MVCLTHLAKAPFRRAFPVRFVIARAGISARSEEPCETPRHCRRRRFRGCRTALRQRRPCRCADQGGRRHAHQATRRARNTESPSWPRSFGAEGTGLRSGQELILADNEQDFAASCVETPCRPTGFLRRLARRARRRAAGTMMPTPCRPLTFLLHRCPLSHGSEIDDDGIAGREPTVSTSTRFPMAMSSIRRRADRVHYLNKTAAIVFELCDGARDADDIVPRVSRCSSLGLPPTVEIRGRIDALLKEGLVLSVRSDCTHLSRRISPGHGQHGGVLSASLPRMRSRDRRSPHQGVNDLCRTLTAPTIGSCRTASFCANR